MSSHRSLSMFAVVLAIAATYTIYTREQAKPTSSDSRIAAAMLAPENLDGTWTRYDLNEIAKLQIPTAPCADYSLFSEQALLARAAEGLSAGRFGAWVSESVVVVDETAAIDAFERVPERPGCSKWNVTTRKTGEYREFTISSVDIGPFGDDSIAYRFSIRQGAYTYVANVVVVRNGGVVIEVMHTTLSDAPDVDQTRAIVQAALAKADRTGLDSESYEAAAP